MHVSKEISTEDSGTPSVCVVIPTIQRRTFLEETLSHLVKTRFPHDRLEVFIADGGSTDGSKEVVENLILFYRILLNLLYKKA